MKGVFLILFLIVGYFAKAQDSRSVATSSSKTKSFAYYLIQSQKQIDAFNKHPINLYYDRLIVEYHDRMNANVKRHKVIARKMKKPQYSDPSYFGHKRKPKKREVGKRKYCKECEIVH